VDVEGAGVEVPLGFGEGGGGAEGVHDVVAAGNDEIGARVEGGDGGERGRRSPWVARAWGAGVDVGHVDEAEGRAVGDGLGFARRFGWRARQDEAGGAGETRKIG